LPAAQRLLARAANREVRLHLPSICLNEARHAITRRCQPRGECDAVRGYVAWALDHGQLTSADAATVRRVVDGFEQKVKRELALLGSALAELRQQPEAIHVFALDDEMLARAAEIGAMDWRMEPFDQAILAAVLVTGERLRDAGEEDVCFCELDGDLQPWDKGGNAKQPLLGLYEAAKVRVYGGSELDAASRPHGWGASSFE
jgi:hypothetical protein